MLIFTTSELQIRKNGFCEFCMFCSNLEIHFQRYHKRPRAGIGGVLETLGITRALGAFGVDVVGQGLVDVEQVATYQRDGGLLEEVLLVEQLAREVIG